MDKLNGFRDKDYLEQVTLLYEIDKGRDVNALPGLMDLFVNPTRDQAVDRMVVNALHSILATSPTDTIAGLASPHPGVRVLCVQVSGESRFTEAVDPLMDLIQTVTDPDLLYEVLNALSRIKTPECLPVFRSFMTSQEPYICTLCVFMLGEYKDEASVQGLIDMVEDSDEDDRYEVCDLSTWEAVKALAAIGTDEAISFLAVKLRHRNPTVRRIVTDCLTAMGERPIPFLTPPFAQKALNTAGVDQQTLAANVLGFIGSRKGADVLVAGIDRGAVEHPNVKYAVYEALGRIGTMKGIICLMDGLDEEDDLTLMAVVTALDRHVNPGIIKNLSGRLAAGGDKAARLSRAIASAKALNIFGGLYPDPAMAEILVTAVCLSKDPEVLEAFGQALVALGTDQAKAHAARLPDLAAKAGAKKVIAADDSKSMLALYRAILTDLGLVPLTATNGQEAFDHVDRGEMPDLVITDMNMPVMDGLEFTGKLRSTPGLEQVPIIMVTTESEGTQRGLAQKTGVTEFLTKPFKPAQLAELVLKYLG